MGKVALIAVAVLVTATGAGQDPSKDAIEASANKVKELQKERIAVLKDAAEVSTTLAQAARIDVSDALEDTTALLEAELDAAETEPERSSLYKKAVDSLKGLEELARAQKQAARGTELSIYRIKARRLELEIQWERAKIKELE